jgi:transposase
MDGSKEHLPMTAGLDLGDRYSYLCLIDQHSGEVVEEGRLRTSPEALRRRFCSELPMRIAIEAGTHSPWVSRMLEECGHEVLVANARKLRLIYANKRKTDEIDAENLARLARLDPKLLYPLTHRGEGSQAHLAIIRSRQALVDTRTQLVNHVRGAVKSKEGEEMLRKLLVSSAHYILGPFGSDSDLRRHGEKIASRGGKNAKKRAAVAVARKLAVLLHRLWIGGEVYEPLHNAHRRTDVAA